MKRVGDVREPRLGTYIRFRIGSGIKEGETAYGQVIFADVDSGGYTVCDGAGNTANFNWLLGDRITWYSGKPWSPARGAARHAEDAAQKQLNVREREAVKAEIARMKKLTDWAMALFATATCALITYALVRDADRMVEFFTRMFS